MIRQIEKKKCLMADRRFCLQVLPVDLLWGQRNKVNNICQQKVNISVFIIDLRLNIPDGNIFQHFNFVFL